MSQWIHYIPGNPLSKKCEQRANHLVNVIKVSQKNLLSMTNGTKTLCHTLNGHWKRDEIELKRQFERIIAIDIEGIILGHIIKQQHCNKSQTHISLP